MRVLPTPAAARRVGVSPVTDITACRGCGASTLDPVLDLGVTPLADRLVTDDQLLVEEPMAPLTVLFCRRCSLVQIRETVAPQVLFHDAYPYFSSVSDTLMRHTRAHAEHLIEWRRLGRKSLVIELASNDGYMLKHFVERGIPVLGVDPARPPAHAARKLGVPTLCEFFTLDLARDLATQGRMADLVIANNVVTHVANLGGFLDGIRTILVEDGVAVVEVPYVRDLIDHCEFDTIYHQHLCYFSATSAAHVLRRHGLYLNDVLRIPIHGGSLRLYVGHTERPSARVQALLGEEHSDGLDHSAYYARFADHVDGLRAAVRMLVTGLRSEGARIAAYGAAAKATTLMSACGLNASLIDYVVDRNVFKQGRFMPGNRLPIVAPERLLENRPDFLLILAWNFAAEIIAQQKAYRRAGGRFVVPIPEPRIV